MDAIIASTNNTVVDAPKNPPQEEERRRVRFEGLNWSEEEDRSNVGSQRRKEKKTKKKLRKELQKQQHEESQRKFMSKIQDAKAFIEFVSSADDPNTRGQLLCLGYARAITLYCEQQGIETVSSKLTLTEKIACLLENWDAFLAGLKIPLVNLILKWKFKAIQAGLYDGGVDTETVRPTEVSSSSSSDSDSSQVSSTSITEVDGAVKKSVKSLLLFVAYDDVGHLIRLLGMMMKAKEGSTRSKEEKETEARRCVGLFRSYINVLNVQTSSPQDDKKIVMDWLDEQDMKPVERVFHLVEMLDAVLARL